MFAVSSHEYKCGIMPRPALRIARLQRRRAAGQDNPLLPPPRCAPSQHSPKGNVFRPVETSLPACLLPSALISALSFLLSFAPRAAKEKKGMCGKWLVCFRLIWVIFFLELLALDTCVEYLNFCFKGVGWSLRTCATSKFALLS